MIALFAGLLGAVFHRLLYRFGPAELSYIFYVVPAVFWTSAAVVIVGLYWQAGRAPFRSDPLATLYSVLALALFVLGVCGAVWCYWHHICMEGHMAHPPYPAWHYALDAGWVACLAAAVFWVCRVQSVLSIGFASFAAFLLAFRFLLGSAGGMYGGFPL